MSDQQLNSLLIKVLGGCFFGVLAGIAVTALLSFLFNAFIAPFRNNKLSEKAEKEGRRVIVKLKKVKMLIDVEEKGKQKNYEAIYECIWHEKKLKYKNLYLSYPPEEEVVYVTKKDKCICYYDLGRLTTYHKFAIFIVVFVFVSIVSGIWIHP